MNNEINERITDEEAAKDEIKFLDYLIILAKHKKLIILITLIAAITAATYSYIKPPQYISTVKILPPSKSISNIGSMLNQLPGFVLNNFNRANSTITSREALTEILYTRPVINKFIQKMQSIDRYKDKYDEDDEVKTILSGFKGIVWIMKSDKGSPVITFSAMDRDPEVAADKANLGVEALNERLQELAIIKEHQRGLFFDKELDQANENLIKSEQEMIKFQVKTGILEVGGKLNITIDKFAPELLLEYKRILRQMKYDEKIFEIMLSQYESARIDEAKNPSILQVIEKAVPPDHYYRGTFKRIIKYSVVAFLLSVLIAFILEYVEVNAGNKETAKRVELLKKYLSFKQG